MMNKLQKFLETVGLDWLPVLLGKSIFDKNSPEAENKDFIEIEEKFYEINSHKKLDDAVAYCNNLLKREEERLRTIESKAFALLGITGITTSLIVGFAEMLLDTTKIDSVLILIFIGFMYSLVVISLILTILLSVKVVMVGEYKFTYPAPKEILRLANESLLTIKRKRATASLYSFLSNQQVINQKATYLGGAQLWFRNSIILLLFLSLGLAIFSPLKYLSSPTIAVTPTMVSNSTNTVISTPMVLPRSTSTLRETDTPITLKTLLPSLTTMTYKSPIATPKE